MVAGIVDQYGRPIRRQVLAKEVATPELVGVRRTIEDQVASGMSPERLATVLRDAALGEARAYLTLAEEIEERYLHYASQLQTRRLAIEGIAMSIEAPDGVPATIVDFAHELIEDGKLAEICGELTDAVGKGYAVAEIMWEYQAGRLRPIEYKARDPRYFRFDRKSLTELRLATDSGLGEGEELAPGKFIRHVPRSKMGIPLRRGMARPAAWAWLIQGFTLKDWAAFAEVYGLPLRVGKYHPSASEADKRSLLRAVRDIGADAGAIIPQGMELEFVKVEGQHGAAVFGGLIDYVDKQVSKLVVGQTMTSDDGASMAQAKVHNEVRLDILKADCRALGQTITRDVLVLAIAMNFGPQAAYPRAELPVAEPEDVAALTTAVAKLVPLGLKVSQREMRDKIGLSEPIEGEEVLMPPAAGPAEGEDSGEEPTPKPPAKRKAVAKLHAAGCGCAACGGRAALAAGPPQDGTAEADAMLEAALEGWEKITDPLLGPLRRILNQANSFEEAQAMLAAAGPDGTALTEALARVTAIARGIGDVRD